MKLPEWMHLGCKRSRLSPHPRAIYTAKQKTKFGIK
jgi:hypothetical protein